MTLTTLRPYQRSCQPRKSRSPSLSTVISGAATAVAKALGENSEQRKEGGSCTSAGPSVGVSPGKAVDLRMKNYQQLRYIQQLISPLLVSLCVLTSSIPFVVMHAMADTLSPLTSNASFVAGFPRRL